jgi:hypothetical protein
LHVCKKALTGLAFLLGLLYASEGNLDGIDEGASDSTVVNIFSIAIDNKIPRALAMTRFLIINLFFAFCRFIIVFHQSI